VEVALVVRQALVQQMDCHPDEREKEGRQMDLLQVENQVQPRAQLQAYQRAAADSLESAGWHRTLQKG
jgi:hypothetical protein